MRSGAAAAVASIPGIRARRRFGWCGRWCRVCLGGARLFRSSSRRRRRSSGAGDSISTTGACPYWPCENHQETLLADHGLYWDTVLASFKLLLLAEFGAWGCRPEAAEQLGVLAPNAASTSSRAAVTKLPVQCEPAGSGGFAGVRRRREVAGVRGPRPNTTLSFPRRRRGRRRGELPLDDVRAVASSRGRSLRTRVRAATGTAG